jgi:hypothetical protein
MNPSCLPCGRHFNGPISKSSRKVTSQRFLAPPPAAAGDSAGSGLIEEPLLPIEGSGDGAAVDGLVEILGIGVAELLGTGVGAIDALEPASAPGVVEGIGDGSSEDNAPGKFVIPGAGTAGGAAGWLVNKAVPTP